MKVLIVFNHPAPYKVNLFNEISKIVDLDVVFERTRAKDRPDSFYYNNQYDFNVTFFKKGYFNNENSWSNELKNYIKENHSKYDLIIMNGYSTISEMKAIRYMKKRNIPFTLYINGGVIKKECFIKRKIKTYFISSASEYFSPCEEANEYLRHYGSGNKKIYLYTYSTFFESERLKKPIGNDDRLKLRLKYNLPNGKLYVSASQFIDRKNNMLLLKLFENREDNLLLIGAGKQLNKYKRYIKRHSMQNVFIVPFLKREKLFKLLSACDAFITLSKEDIYGHTTNEAFASSLPVISSNRVISSRHLIKDGYNGYLVNLDNIEMINDLLNKDYDHMRLNALNTAYENTIEKMIESHKIIFEEMKK